MAGAQVGADRPLSREPTKNELLKARSMLPFDNTMSLSRLQHQRLHAKPRVLLNIPVERAVALLRQKISARLPSGPHGLIRCWMQFREKAGATKDGVNYEQFVHALDTYGLNLPDQISRQFFGKMDMNGNGFISINEFTDVIIGRFPSSASGITLRDKRTNGANQAQVLTKKLNVDLPTARLMLKKKIISSLKSGSFGVMRMWKLFRSKCGASKEGVYFSEFKHGLTMYGLHFEEDINRALFNSIDVNQNGSIQIFEFIDNLMGRWTAENNSIQAIGAHEEADLMIVAKGEAKRRIRQAESLRRLRDEQQIAAEAQRERVTRKNRKPKRIPIWRRTTASARIGMVHSASAGSTTKTSASGATWASPVKQKSSAGQGATGRLHKNGDLARTQRPPSEATPQLATGPLSRPMSASTSRASIRELSQSLRTLDTPALDTPAGSGPRQQRPMTASSSARGSTSRGGNRTSNEPPPSPYAEDELLMNDLDEDISAIKRDMQTRRSALSRALSARNSIRAR